jgi:hypothetical protein
MMPTVAWFAPEIVMFLKSAVVYLVVGALLLLSIVLVFLSYEQLDGFNDSPLSAKLVLVGIVTWGFIIAGSTIGILLFREEIARFVRNALR